MKYEDYQKIVNSIITKPEDGPVEAEKLLEEIKNDLNIIESQNKKIDDLDNKTRSLQDTNIKLFLRQTNNVSEDKSDDEQIDPHELAKRIMEGK